MSEKIEIRNIAEACEHFAKVCGANKNLYRVIGSVIDGLKPGQRRILIALYGIENSNHGREIMKVARIVGDTMGKYHPHGDASIKDMVVALAQPWNNNVPVIKSEGNFGGMDGSEAGQMRYISAALSDYCWDCFFTEYDDVPIDMKESYTGRDLEPEWLPAKYPNALFNGSLSIGYGLASNIPPYNVKEVLEATINLIKNKDYDVVLYPDSPTGCNIIDEGQFEDISHTGTGSFKMEATYEIDEKNNVIRITSLPYQVNSLNIIKVITSKEKRKEYPEMTDVKDFTKANNVDIRIELKQDANPNKFVEKLLKKTLMRKAYPVDIKLIDDYQDFDYNLKSYLLEWIDYRRDIKRAKYNNLMTTVMEKKHINDIMLFILNDDNAETTIKIANTSEDREEIAERLMKTYGITSLQAKTISQMSIDSFTRKARKSYEQEDKDLKEKINEYNKYIDDDKEIDKIIISELNTGIKKWGRERQSKVISDVDKKYVPKTNHILSISEDGYCKKLGEHPESIGKVGKDNAPFTTVAVNNRDEILIFLANGVVANLAVSSIGECVIEDVGIPLTRYFDVSSKVMLIMKRPDKDIMKDNTYTLAFVTKKGYVKRTLLSEFIKIKGTTTAINVDDDDELVSTFVSNEQNDEHVIIYTNKGNGINLHMNELKTYKKSAKGLRSVDLSDNEFIVGADKLYADKELILYVTAQGKVKITEAKYLPKVSRRSELINLISLDDEDSLCRIKSINGDEILDIRKKYGKMQELDMSDIPVSARVSKATKMITLKKGDYIVSIIERK